MTPHQLHLLDLIATSGNMAPLHPPEREAVLAILAERDRLLAACTRLATYHQLLPIESLFDIMKAIEAEVEKANGDPACGG